MAPVAASVADVIHSAARRASAAGSANVSMRPFISFFAASARRAKNEAFHRLGKAFVVIGCGGGAGLRLDLIGRVAHRNAEARSLEHEHVVRLITDGSYPLGRHLQMTR